DWEFEKDGRVVKISPPAKLIATHLGLALRAVHDGVGYWATFEGYVRYGVKSGALVSVLDDWCPPFDGPFLYYPSRRQPRPRSPPSCRSSPTGVSRRGGRRGSRARSTPSSRPP